jgi:hypothetical protein
MLSPGVERKEFYPTESWVSCPWTYLICRLQHGYPICHWCQ